MEMLYPVNTNSCTLQAASTDWSTECYGSTDDDGDEVYELLLTP
ncbi:MAG: hypothetical protein U5K00_01035 [Melioribacteraceae bacterium]|nr:hypothetical protein [Melioribacteraceae bacterium]